MVCLNVQGFLKHKDKIEVILDKIAPSLAGFTEIHVTQEVEDHELYISVRGNSETDRTGGILLYIKKEIKLKLYWQSHVIGAGGQ